MKYIITIDNIVHVGFSLLMDSIRFFIHEEEEEVAGWLAAGWVLADFIYFTSITKAHRRSSFT